MKPKPFSALNHLTVPIAMLKLLQERSIWTPPWGPDSAVPVIHLSSAMGNGAWPRAFRTARHSNFKIKTTPGWAKTRTGLQLFATIPFFYCLNQYFAPIKARCPKGDLNPYAHNRH